MIKVDFTVSDLSGKVIKTYALNLEPSQILIEVDNAREVWDEYHVRAKSDNPIAPFEVFKTKTYKQEMMMMQSTISMAAFAALTKIRRPSRAMSETRTTTAATMTKHSANPGGR
jgi:hypothetical protein